MKITAVRCAAVFGLAFAVGLVGLWIKPVAYCALGLSAIAFALLVLRPVQLGYRLQTMHRRNRLWWLSALLGLCVIALLTVAVLAIGGVGMAAVSLVDGGVPEARPWMIGAIVACASVSWLASWLIWAIARFFYDRGLVDPGVSSS